jgi:hypothetical protein
MVMDGMNYASWETLNKRLLQAFTQCNWEEIKLIYYELAMFMQKEGRDTFRFIHESLKSELAASQDSTFNRVEIITAADACEECKRKSGQIYTLEEIQAEPVIPLSAVLIQPAAAATHR